MNKTLQDYTKEQLIKEFHKTNAFNKYDRLLTTKVYTEEELANIKGIDILFKQNTITTSFEDTITEILSNTGYIAALNFADGYEPGGLVLDGYKTQEESLCRSSNLYKALTTEKCWNEYYNYNKKDRRFSLGKSSDRIIYTRNVTFFRDTNLEWIDERECRLCDVITCAAPYAGRASDDEIKHRMKNIIKVANDNRVNTLILGCWGCGAFGNDWEHFSKLWWQVFSEIETQCKIIMATNGKDFISEDILEAIEYGQF